MATEQFLSVSDVARRLEAKPQHISQLFYRRIISDESAPISGRRRLIPESMLDEIAAHLRRLGQPVIPEPLEKPTTR